MPLSSFRLEFDADHIAILTFDVPGSKVNTLGQAVVAEIEEVLGQLESRKGLRGLILKTAPALVAAIC